MLSVLSRIVLLVACWSCLAYAAPPDEIPRAMAQPVGGAVSGSHDDERHAAAVALLTQAAGTAGTPVDENYQRPDAIVSGEPTDAEREEAARLAVWNSEEMLEARRYALEVGKHSARSSEREAQAFLNRLSTLSSTQMTQWLQRLQAQRRGIALQRAIEDEAREARTEESLALLREQQAAREQIHQWQARSTGWLQSRFETERALTELRRGERADAIAAQRLQFNPFYPTLDPMTPPAKVAGAVTLPGDLPRSDPRNFIRGEEGVDFGDGSVGTSGVAAPVAPSPAPPTPPSAAPVAVEGGSSGAAEAGGGE